MPVMILYKDKKIEPVIASDIAEAVAEITKELLDANIEVRAVEPIYSFSANEVHLEMRFRDFGDYTDEQLAEYHKKVMATMGKILKDHKVACGFSFYIVPSKPPRAIWAQDKIS